MESTELETKAIPSLTKTISQVKINQFESCGIRERENIHNSPELAKQRLGTTYPIASGRMSIAISLTFMSLAASFENTCRCQATALFRHPTWRTSPRAGNSRTGAAPLS